MSKRGTPRTAIVTSNGGRSPGVYAGGGDVPWESDRRCRLPYGQPQDPEQADRLALAAEEANRARREAQREAQQAAALETLDRLGRAPFNTSCGEGEIQGEQDAQYLRDLRVAAEVRAIRCTDEGPHHRSDGSTVTFSEDSDGPVEILIRPDGSTARTVSGPNRLIVETKSRPDGSRVETKVIREDGSWTVTISSNTTTTTWSPVDALRSIFRRR